MRKRNFLLSVLMIISSLLFAVPIDKEYAKSQIVLGETVSYNHGKIKKSVSVIDGNEGAKNLQLASALSLSSSEIEYKEGFSVSASIKNSATTAFTGDLGLALYDVNFELLTIIDVQDTTISAGGTIDCTFATEGWSELVAGSYYAVIYSKTVAGEWESIGDGSFQNKEQFRIGIVDECSDKVVYECDFESELLDWTFAKADGINTGFAVGTATKYQGDKSLYISPDGGQSTGYTQDGDSGYVSVAYKKIYLEAGNYYFYWKIYRKLSYSYIDVFSDYDYYNIAIVPAENKIEPQASFVQTPSFLNENVYKYAYSYNYSYWESEPYNYSFTIKESGNYYLVHSFSATDTITNTTGVAIDNIKIEKRRSKYSSSISVSKTETKEGVVFNISGDYPEYRLYWYTDCDGSYKRDTINTNSYTIPFTKLRDVIQGMSNLYFNVSATDDCNKSTSTGSWYSVYTDKFPTDTCPAVPKNIKLAQTDTSLVFTWQGNAGVYDVKYGSSSYGCSWIDTINSFVDTAYTIKLDHAFYKKYSGSSLYFFVRGICDNDTSLWKPYGSSSISYPSACSSDICWARPCNLSAQNTPEGIKLAWRGNASKYEIACYSEDAYYRRGSQDTLYKFIATDSMYVIPFGVLPDTLYHFEVRAICDKDTSLWSSEYKSAYNINFGEYCIPFYDLYGSNTLCTYGSYSNPYSNKGTLDYRQKDWDESYYGSSSGYRNGINGTDYYRSRHTICFEGEVDPRCDSLLTTVPPGEKYSIRLGNWYNGEGESVTYTHKIDSGYRLILLLKYAVVLQDPSHESIENPHFTLEILDENDQLLDSECLYADFAADKNATGWNNAVNAHEPTEEEFRNVVWKDWTTIGVNLSDLSQYGDRVIKIRLTTKDCTRGQHYGYAYFTLQCTSGDMVGVKCAERPLFFEVAEGFKYRWYLMDDITKTSVWDQHRFEVAELDTNSYYVDMISLENEDCYYTMKAYTLPRMPESKAEYTLTPHDCLNEVSFVNKSEVYKIMLDGSHMLDSRVVIDSVIWDFGVYGKSLEDNPKIVVPNEGDTFNITLRTVANGCEHIEDIEVKVPAIRDTMTYVSASMCEGDTLIYEDKYYTSAGVYMDTLKRLYGCDSVVQLTIDYITPIEEYVYDTISDNLLPYKFYDQECMSTGEYKHVIYAEGGCDSIIYNLSLQVYEKLLIRLEPLSEICGDDKKFVIPYIIDQGMFANSELKFNEFALNEGFVNVSQPRGANNEIDVCLPDSVRPDDYSVDIIFYSYGGDSVTMPLEFRVLYPSSVIGQRWNDLLGVKNEHYNGGYTFTDYQWYLNGEPIEGYKATQIYEYGKELDFEGEYRVLLTRADDGKSIMSCPFTPVKYNEDEYTELSTLVYTNQIVVANASHAAEAKMYNVAGVCVGTYAFEVGYNDVKMPSEVGVYTMQVVYDSDKIQVIRIVVRK